MSYAPSVKLPEHILEKAFEISKEEGISIEIFVSRAVEEKAAAWERFKYLKERAERATREKFIRALSRVPDSEPEEHDAFE